MIRRSELRAAWMVGVVLLLIPCGRAESAPFNVYYRADANTPWVFYSGAATNAAAQDTLAELTSLGYLAEIVPGATPPAAVVSGPTYITGNTYYPPSGVYNSVGSFGFSYGGGGYYRSGYWHRYNHFHPHPHVRPLPFRHHPTPHPHHRFGPYGAHRGGHQVRHHAVHHSHAHAHGHSHGHGRR